MEKKRLWVTVFVVVLFFINTYESYADQIEGGFKNICNLIAEENAIQMPLTYTTSEEGIKRTARLLNEWQEGLRGLIKLAPDSIWADDAQYILSILYAANPQQGAAELEYLLKAYPDMQFEEWTKEKLPSMMPSVAPSLDIRVQLAICYKQLGDNEKLRQFCEESIEKFPENRAIFERFLKRISSPVPK